MKYFVVVLPTDLENKTNRQIYEFEDLESAKQSYHSNCAKYFKNDNISLVSVCIIDSFSNKIISDYWSAPVIE